MLVLAGGRRAVLPGLARRRVAFELHQRHAALEADGRVALRTGRQRSVNVLRARTRVRGLSVVRRTIIGLYSPPSWLSYTRALTAGSEHLHEARSCRGWRVLCRRAQRLLPFQSARQSALTFDEARASLAAAILTARVAAAAGVELDERLGRSLNVDRAVPHRVCRDLRLEAAQAEHRHGERHPLALRLQGDELDARWHQLRRRLERLCTDVVHGGSGVGSCAVAAARGRAWHA
eukprot:5743123-Prymnesium_polylepis.1